MFLVSLVDDLCLCVAEFIPLMVCIILCNEECSLGSMMGGCYETEVICTSRGSHWYTANVEGIWGLCSGPDDGIHAGLKDFC